MVAQVATDQGVDVRLVTEIRGQGSRLWTDNPTGEIIYSGPAGTGKTRTLLEYIHQRCQGERLRALFLRKTEESLKTSALVTFREQVLYRFDGKRSVLDGVTFFGGNKLLPAQFTYDKTGSVIVLGGVDNPEKIKSSEWDIVFVNEATELTMHEWEMVTGRTDRPSLMDRPPSLVIGDCNPDAPTHWIKQRGDIGKLTLWTSTHVDNPAMWDRQAERWTPAGERYLKRLDEHTGVRYQRLRLGRWVAAEGQVYEEWDETKHLIPRAELPTEWPRIWGLDFGFVNPFVWGSFAIHPDGRLILEHELYLTRMLVEDVAKTIMRFWGNRPVPVAVVRDHDAEDAGTFEKATGLFTTPADKDVTVGIQAVQARLRSPGDGTPRLQFMRDSLIHAPDAELRERGKPVNTAQEMPTYIWDPRQTSIKARSERPLKVDDHGMDMTRYVVMYADDPTGGYGELPTQTVDWLRNVMGQ
jgi:phage terminase large subunit